MVLLVRNLRRFVCSVWTGIGRLAEAVTDRCCIEWRQKATDVANATDLGSVHRHLTEGLTAAMGCHVRIVLQELETVNGNPHRLADWSEIAKEVGATVS